MADHGESMFVSRVQVSEGFLDGLDIKLVRGLNVLVGARGTGKTSVIELIRFALSATAFTSDALRRGNQQASAVLQGGIVTVTLTGSSGDYTISKSADGRSTATAARVPSCVVLAQNEVEAVGVEALGRLRLIDRFRAERDSLANQSAAVGARLSSVTAEIRGVLEEGTALRNQIAELAAIEPQLAEATTAQQKLLDEAEASVEDQQMLARLQQAASTLATRESIYLRSEQSLLEFISDLRRVARRPNSLFEEWPPQAGAQDLLADLRASLRAVSQLLSASLKQAEDSYSQFVGLRSNDDLRRQGIDAQTRQLRQRLESVQAGISEATRRVADLHEKDGQRSALESLFNEREARYRSLLADREVAYAELEGLRDHVFHDRQSIATQLNDQLGPAIRIRVERSSGKEAYLSALVAGLRGSGLHYNTLAPTIVERISPYELVRWVEQGNIVDLANTLGISPDRAQALTAALRNSATPEIIASVIEDGVTLELLDGRDYKESTQLSIGQRCTVVLPILLSNHEHPLLVDQPEDHLDNAFVATTLVGALRRRRTTDQIIFTSHNANIPVLGEADHVIAMKSDGSRGYIDCAGPLDDPRVVAAISRVMEGGSEAFARRAAFYRENAHQ